VQRLTVQRLTVRGIGNLVRSPQVFAAIWIVSRLGRLGSFIPVTKSTHQALATRKRRR
jgi:hypothetical protein